MKYYAASKTIIVKTCSHGKDVYVVMGTKKTTKNRGRKKKKQILKPEDFYDSSDEKLYHMRQDKQLLGKNVRLGELLMVCICFQKLFWYYIICTVLK